MFSATYDPDLHAEPQTPDMKIYLGIEFHAIENEVAHHPDYYSIEDTYLPHLSKFYSPHINWISNQLPPSPPLTQLRDLPAVSLPCAVLLDLNGLKGSQHKMRTDLGSIF